MFKPVSSKLDVPALEREQIETWRERGTMDRYLARNQGSEKRFSFLDGPITANNPMGVHHAWGRTYKDLYQRYHTMLGDRQRYQNGFDCQGLWIEVEVERELGFNNKREIEKFGVDRFVELCKARVNRFAALQTEQSKRLGMWMDWEHSYFTNSDENNYTIWAFLKECHTRGLIYKGHDVMPWCPRCGTGLSNMEIATEGYREIRHLSLTIRLPITSPGHEGEDLLVWTTTPVDPVQQRGGGGPPRPHLSPGRGDRRAALVGIARLARAGGAGRNRRSRGARRGAGRADLCRPVRRAADPGRASSTASSPWSDVNDEEGTGIVHIAPGCGQEDFALAKRDGHCPSSTRSTSSASSATGTAGRQAASPAPPTIRPRTWRRTSPPTSRAKGLLVSARALPASLPGLLALRHTARLPAGRRVVHRHGPAARSRSAP